MAIKSMKKNLQKFGRLLKELRLKQQLSLRDVCKEIGYDPSNWSKIERGLISPPSDEKVLKKWAEVLGLKSVQQKEFIDEAVIAQGVIPEDILQNIDAIKLMPAFFRTLRNEKPNKEEIDNLIRLLKNN
jgi:transcriptional regulator with XRE-family HTH domain